MWMNSGISLPKSEEERRFTIFKMLFPYELTYTLAVSNNWFPRKRHYSKIMICIYILLIILSRHSYKCLTAPGWKNAVLELAEKTIILVFFALYSLTFYLDYGKLLHLFSFFYKSSVLSSISAYSAFRFSIFKFLKIEQIGDHIGPLCIYWNIYWGVLWIHWVCPLEKILPHVCHRCIQEYWLHDLQFSLTVLYKWP